MSMFVVLLGGPGAGKGTQAKNLVRDLGIPQISTGDLFRDNLKNETELGKLARTYIDRGELVPDEVTVAMVQERFSRSDCDHGALLDGFPRTIPQAEGLDALLAEKNEQLLAVPYINVSPEVLLQRLAGRWTCRQCGAMYHAVFGPPKTDGLCDKCGGELYQRADDTPETQQRRIDIYFKQTAPLINWYQEKSLLVEIDGEGSIESVGVELLAAIKAAAV